ncbi:MAG: hypothetical protein QG639_569 [Patescibacteria group bacterium]|nr:hypothetical protein [Patescibacteria group bacterium]
MAPQVDPAGNDNSSAGPPPQSPSQQQSQQTSNPSQAAQQPAQNEEYAQYNPNESAIIPGMAKPLPEEILFEWEALSRPFKARNRQYFTTIGLIAALVALILLFAGQMFSVAVIAAVIFVIYVLNTTPPGMVNHKLTTYGIRVENNLYYWEEMGRFWFTEKFGQHILNIEIARFPNRLTLLLGDVNKDDMQLVLSEVLLNQQPPPTAYEKAAAWLQEKLPIDIES